MRCAMWSMTGIVLAVAVVGCGGEADAPATSERLENTSSVDGAAAATGSDDAAEYTYREVGDADASRTPAIERTSPSTVHRDDRFSEPKSVGEPKTESQQQAKNWVPETQFRPGTRTAGSIDDHAKYDA